MRTYIITEHLDYVALVLLAHKRSFIYNGIDIQFAASRQFIENLRMEDGLIHDLPIYEQKP